MKADKRYDNQAAFWEQAGEKGYNNVIFSTTTVADHITAKQNTTALAVARESGFTDTMNILELGCGDGEFTEYILAPHFRHIDAYDQSTRGIEIARARQKAANIAFSAADLTTHEFKPGDQWDGVFCIAFLHHVKAQAETVVERLSRVTTRVVILEPNGNNLLRKMFELTPSYRSAGEQSFRLGQLLSMFGRHGFRPVAMRRITFVPSVCPQALFPLFKLIEKIVETVPFLRWLTASYVIGFKRKYGE